jgi:pimeloyl-ACP methyl ester carboxylesterase
MNMATRLVVLSDMWGVKKGLWITSYLGYLQQHFDITFYDCQQLAGLDLNTTDQEKVHEAFVNGGIDTAVAHLLKRETEPAHYLVFSLGGVITWKAALKGLPIISLWGVSATRVRFETEKPACETHLLFGENDKCNPPVEWISNMNVDVQVVPGFGHDMYTDEKIVQKVCLKLLQKAMFKMPS